MTSTRCSSKHPFNGGSSPSSPPSTSTDILTISLTLRDNHTKRLQTPTIMNHCTICASDLDTALRISPQDHERRHDDDERACGQCWEAYLSLKIEERRPDEIECMFCKSRMSEADIMSFARKATTIRYGDYNSLEGQVPELSTNASKVLLQEAAERLRLHEPLQRISPRNPGLQPRARRPGLHLHPLPFPSMHRL
jgi:hypothetical protein